MLNNFRHFQEALEKRKESGTLRVLKSQKEGLIFIPTIIWDWQEIKIFSRFY
jgi:hypothetical protein